ncbi:MAG: leucine-rich repeat domain-containing protein [Paramuribaculum sp.]|nr:leucine-rich repeat domain-containing protein [Paramuribaculum sp.]
MATLSNLLNNLRNFFGNFSGRFTSESGTFHHVDGIVNSFTPSPENIIKDGFDAPDGWNGNKVHHPNAIKTLIIPEGVKGFSGHFLTGWAVTKSVVFPDSLQSIGKHDSDSCVFSGCYLPEVVLPKSLKCLGAYAFGNCHIKKLVVPPTVRSRYNRQFKDSTIEELYLPKIILERGKITIGNQDHGFYLNFYIQCHCNIIEY